MKRIVMLCASIGAANLMAQEPPPMSLQDAIHKAVQNNLDIHLERINVDYSTIDLELTRAGYEPMVGNTTSFQSYDARPRNEFEGDPESTITNDTANFDLSFSKAEDFGFDWYLNFNNELSDSTSGLSFGESYSSTLSAGLKQKLLRGFAFDTEISRKDEFLARTDLAISRLGLHQIMSQVLMETENAYWDLFQAIEALKVKQNSLQLAKQLYDQNKIKIEVGTLAPIELVNAEATVASREAEIVSAENAVRAAEDTLKRILNLPPEDWSTHIRPADEPETIEISTDVVADFETALRERPEMRQSELAKDNALLDLKYQRNQLLPELNFEGAYFLRGVSNPVVNDNDVVTRQSSYSNAVQQIQDQDLPGYQVSLQLNWTPFNKSAKLNKARTEVMLRQRELEIERERLRVLEDVRGSVRELETAEKQIKANEKARTFAEANLRAEQQKFQNGLTTNYRVAEVQDELAQAINNEIQARIDYRKALTAYYKALGVLVDRRNITIQ